LPQAHINFPATSNLSGCPNLSACEAPDSGLFVKKISLQQLQLLTAFFYKRNSPQQHLILINSTFPKKPVHSKLSAQKAELPTTVFQAVFLKLTSF